MYEFPIIRTCCILTRTGIFIPQKLCLFAASKEALLYQSNKNPPTNEIMTCCGNVPTGIFITIIFRQLHYPSDKSWIINILTLPACHSLPSLIFSSPIKIRSIFASSFQCDAFLMAVTIWSFIYFGELETGFILVVFTVKVPGTFPWWHVVLTNYYTLISCEVV